jgi:NADH dehydrogenase/NADH:ubiquinone oxidoreductase subunit G
MFRENNKCSCESRFAVQRAVPVPGDARDDWKILVALAEVAGRPLPYSSLEGVRRRLADVAPHFAAVDAVEPPLWLNGEYFKVRGGGWLSIRDQMSCCACQRGPSASYGFH